MSKITRDHLQRQAFVYVRQSTMDQVQNNRESQRRQYSLTDRARSLGWKEVTVIDDDLGRSGGGVHRPGFERLLASLCEGSVGAVFCIEASRLARNGRDWHTLLEFCRLVDALIVDEDGVYDARQPNDRLLLGMKGTLSEMELSTLRQRSHEAMMQKARRGELFTSVAIGYVRAPNDRLEIDPDRRIRKALDLVFRKFRQFGSARQVLMWLRQERTELPAVAYGPEGRAVIWRLPVYNAVHHILTNPVYAGAYVFGRTKTVTRIQQGRKHSVPGLRLAQEQWQILITQHHEGYIDWDEYQANQRQITHNAAMKGRLVRGPARNGGALLAGLLRCGHCGRKLHVAYSGIDGHCRRYNCQGAMINHGIPDRCISFGGFKADRIIEQELLRRLEPLGVRAALEAIDRQLQDNGEQIAQKELALEQARFEVARARRQYDAVDPDNRLVAGELERRWNEALRRHNEIDAELKTLRATRPEPMSQSTREALLRLGDDLPLLWRHPESSQQLKKRIVRTLLHEIIAKKDGDTISMVLHWQGGDHTTLAFQKSKTGQHRHTTPDNIIKLVRELARVQPDQSIVAILNRLGLRTGHGNTWTEGRLRIFRRDHQIAVYEEGERKARGELTLEETAAALACSTESVRRLIERKMLDAHQACRGAPWIISRADVEKLTEQAGKDGPRTKHVDQLPLKLQ
jgi:DNA invertase Pin-like site-specific DNA recombinase